MICVGGGGDALMTGAGSGREGGRALKTRVKTARNRSLSSTLWLTRQLNDPYVARARREGYRSRAAYKLLEIHEKYKLLKSGQRIVGLVELAADFACQVLAPGGFFLAKVLQGGAEGELLKRLKREFATVRHLKPKASRADSAELYVLATGFRGAARASEGGA